MSKVSHKFIDESENNGITAKSDTQEYSRKRKKPVIRLLLVAAIIVSLSATAYAAVIRLLNWTPEMEEYLAPYNEETSPGAVARDWYIKDVDIQLSIDQPETSVLPISAETWTAEAEGTLESEPNIGLKNGMAQPIMRFTHLTVIHGSFLCRHLTVMESFPGQPTMLKAMVSWSPAITALA